MEKQKKRAEAAVARAKKTAEKAKAEKQHAMALAAEARIKLEATKAQAEALKEVAKLEKERQKALKQAEKANKDLEKMRGNAEKGKVTKNRPQQLETPLTFGLYNQGEVAKAKKTVGNKKRAELTAEMPMAVALYEPGGGVKAKKTKKQPELADFAYNPTASYEQGAVARTKQSVRCTKPIDLTKLDGPPLVARRPPPTQLAKAQNLYYASEEMAKPQKPATGAKKRALPSAIGEISPGNFQGGIPKPKKANTGKKSAKATAAASSAMGIAQQMGMQLQGQGFQMMVQMVSNQMQPKGGAKTQKARKLKE